MPDRNNMEAVIERLHRVADGGGANYVNGIAGFDIHLDLTRLLAAFEAEKKPAPRADPLAALSEMEQPSCLGCGSPTSLVGDFVQREWQCGGCGEYVLRIVRVGDDG